MLGIQYTITQIYPVINAWTWEVWLKYHLSSIEVSHNFYNVLIKPFIFNSVVKW